jgi:hypothetical protein
LATAADFLPFLHFFFLAAVAGGSERVCEAASVGALTAISPSANSDTKHFFSNLSKQPEAMRAR